MKKILLLFLLLIYLVYPLSVSAGTFDVGITIIKPDQVVDVTTSISTNIIIDEETYSTTPAFVLFENHGNTDISLSIQDIEAGFVGSPTTYLPYSTTLVNGKIWRELDETETKANIAFGISYDGNEFLSILPDTPIDIGDMMYYDPMMGGSPYTYGDGEFGVKPYMIGVKCGYNWGETTSLYYRITFVVALVEGELDYDGDFNPIMPEIAGFEAYYNTIQPEYLTSNLQINFYYHHLEGFVPMDLDINISGKIYSNTKEIYSLNNLEFISVEAQGTCYIPDSEFACIVKEFEAIDSNYQFDEVGMYYVVYTFEITQNTVTYTYYMVDDIYISE